MKQLAIPLSNQKTVAKWLVICGRPHVELSQSQGEPPEVRSLPFRVQRADWEFLQQLEGRAGV